MKDDVQTKCILWKTPGNVFAADVMYHENCLSGYVLKFKFKFIMSDSNDIEDECTKTVIKDVLMSKDLTTSAYHLSDLCEEVTRQLLSWNIGESILYNSVDSIVGKTFLCFQAHSRSFPQ